MNSTVRSIFKESFGEKDVKCVNSAVRSIFKESFGEKEVCGSYEQCTGPTESAETH